MGVRNYLIEGVSGTGKTSVASELQRRGYDAIHGDRSLAYQGDAETGVPVKGAGHAHHIWDLGKVRALVADHQNEMTFFCGGSRNFNRFIDLFDKVFVLDVDQDTLMKRLAERPPGEFGGTLTDRDLIARLNATQEDIPMNAVRIDATLPLDRVVDDILIRCQDAVKGTAG